MRAMENRRLAPRNGGRPSRLIFMPIQVVPHTRHRKAKARYLAKIVLKLYLRWYYNRFKM
jgi:hypothetical protein